MKRTLLFIPVLLSLLLITCGGAKQADTVMDDCNPEQGFYIDGEHYIDAAAVNEDGTLNRDYYYKKTQLHRQGKAKLRACDPSRKTFVDTVRQKRARLEKDDF